MADDLIAVVLTIDNIYEDGTEIQTVVRSLVPPPDGEPDSDERFEWESEHVEPLTGANYPEGGDAGYFVEVTMSSHPELIPVGTKYEFGI